MEAHWCVKFTGVDLAGNTGLGGYAQRARWGWRERRDGRCRGLVG
jgi:hypothetical protein